MKKAIVIGCVGAFLAATAAYGARGAYELPTEWSLAPPSGLVMATGTLPQGAALTADGEHLVVVEDGQAAAAVRIFDARSLATQREIPLSGATGTPLADASGDDFWVSLAASDAIVHIDATNGKVNRTIELPKPFWATAIVRSPDAMMLAVSGDLANAVRFIDLASGTIGPPIAVGKHPGGLAFSADGKTLYAANWGESTLCAIDVATRTVRATIPVGKHPEALLLSQNGTQLYVSETDDDAVGIVDIASQKRVAGINVAPSGELLRGVSPTALALAAHGDRLYVALSAVNMLAALDVAAAKPRLLGVVPTGWYPTALVLARDGATLDVIDGKGEGSRPNPQFHPFARPRDQAGYVAHEMIGSIRRLPIPSDAEFARGLADAFANGVVRKAGEIRRIGDSGSQENSTTPLFAIVRNTRSSIVRADGPIKHVIYVIKENRTYDQVLGDVPAANGDPSLVLFGKAVTPNEHAIAARFGVLDNTFANAEVSADGHNWSVGAFANDYLERMWPPNYGGRRDLYDFEDGAEASTAHNGYLWNAAARAKVTVRNYGEFTTAVSMQPRPHIVSHMSDLAAVTDPLYPGFDLSFSDLDREAEWAREFSNFERDKNLPQLEIVRLPNDHTAGTRPGSLTPTAFVAQNDLAVGRLVERVSHSPYWSDTAIFIVEDDAQNGADHVDAQRMTAYVASAYTAGGVRHAHYSTAGIVGTIETILGLPPLSVFDASARRLDDVFSGAAGGDVKPDLRPFTAIAAAVDLRTTNASTAYRARDSARLDLSREDGVPDATLNDIVWHAVRNRASR